MMYLDFKKIMRKWDSFNRPNKDDLMYDLKVLPRENVRVIMMLRRQIDCKKEDINNVDLGGNNTTIAMINIEMFVCCLFEISKQK